MKWWNYKTESDEKVAIPQSDSRALEFLPQTEAVRNLYMHYRGTGAAILEAMDKVLTACIGNVSGEGGTDVE